MDRYKAADLSIVKVESGKESFAWENVRQLCPDLSEWGAGILKSGLNGHVASILVEPHYMCKDYRNIFGHFYSKKFVERSPASTRLHFFSKSHLSVSDVLLRNEENAKEYIGFSVIQPALNQHTGRCLGRTIIDPMKCGHKQETLFCLRATFKVHLQGADYAVCGYPYMTQSGEAIVCAHSALWGVCRYLSERYREYAEVYPYNLVQMTGDTNGRRVPYRGMLYTDYSTILSNFGCHPVICKPRTFPCTDWLKDKIAFQNIYSYVESGIPVLMSFRGHVATVIGHTVRADLAYDSPDEHGFHDSYALVKQYVVIDDNFFPYQLLGSHGDDVGVNYGKRFEKQLTPFPSKETVYAAVVPLPEKAFMEPHIARTIGTDFFGHKQIKPILSQLITDLNKGTDPLITRLFLTTSNAFKKRKRSLLDEAAGANIDPLSQFPLRLSLPHFIWIMEISPLSLYQNRRVVGEVVIDASADFHERGLIYARLGNRLFFGNKFSTEPQAKSTFVQYTHNLGEL